MSAVRKSQLSSDQHQLLRETFQQFEYEDTGKVSIYSVESILRISGFALSEADNPLILNQLRQQQLQQQQPPQLQQQQQQSGRQVRLVSLEQIVGVIEELCIQPMNSPQVGMLDDAQTLREAFYLLLDRKAEEESAAAATTSRRSDLSSANLTRSSSHLTTPRGGNKKNQKVMVKPPTHICPQALKRLMQALGEGSITDEDVDDMIQEADVDSDGVVGFQDFMQIMKSFQSSKFIS